MGCDSAERGCIRCRVLREARICVGIGSSVGELATQSLRGWRRTYVHMVEGGLIVCHCESFFLLCRNAIEEGRVDRDTEDLIHSNEYIPTFTVERGIAV